jgi:hypothetical protein
LHGVLSSYILAEEMQLVDESEFQFPYVTENLDADLLVVLHLNASAVELKAAPRHDVLGALTADGDVVLWDLRTLGKSYMVLDGVVATTFAIAETHSGPGGTSRLDLLIGTNNDPQLWVVDTGGKIDHFGQLSAGSPYLLQSLWNGKSLTGHISSALFGPQNFIVGGVDGTVRILSRRDGNLIAAVAGDANVGLTAVGVPDSGSLVTAADDARVTLWALDIPETSPRSAPGVDCRLVSANFESSVIPGSLVSSETVACELSAETRFFDRGTGYIDLPLGLPPNPLFPSEHLQLELRPRTAPGVPWIPVGSGTRPVTVTPPLRILTLVPDNALISLVYVSAYVKKQELQFMKDTSELDGLRVVVLAGTMHFTLTLDPPLVAQAMRLSSASKCRVTTTGPSKTSYLIPMTWPEKETVQCGPLGPNNTFPTADPLVFELSPNGVQWFRAPNYITLFELPQFVTLRPAVAPVHSPRWITLRGVNFPLSHNLNMTVFMPPGIVRRAARINSTAITFRSPQVYTARNVQIWIAFGSSPAVNTNLALNLTESPTILNVTPTAFTVGDVRGGSTRRPLNVFGENFLPTDLCLFESTSLPVISAPLYRFVSDTQVQCQAPTLPPEDAVLPPAPAPPTDWCALQVSIAAQLKLVIDQINAYVIKRGSQPGFGASLPGYQGASSSLRGNFTGVWQHWTTTNTPTTTTTRNEATNFTNGTLSGANEAWTLDRSLASLDEPPHPLGMYGSNNTTMNISWNHENASNATLMSYIALLEMLNSTKTGDIENVIAASGLTLTAEEVQLAKERSKLLANYAAALIECAATGPSVVQAQPIGGYLLVKIYSAMLEDAIPLNLGYGAFSVRLLPSMGISSVTPSSGPVTGGTLVAVEGAGFTQIADLSCAINDTVLVNARYISSSLLYCTMPAFSSAGPASVRVASRGYELSYSIVNFTYYPLWTFRLGNEASCFAGQEGDSVVVFVKPAEFSLWTHVVYSALCLFTVAESSTTRYVNTSATIYSWNATMRIVCPCPALSPSLVGVEMPMLLSLDDMRTLTPVVGGQVTVLKRPIVTETLPVVWTWGKPLNLTLSGLDFPEKQHAGLACLLFDDASTPYDFSMWSVRQDGQWRGLVGDNCPPPAALIFNEFQWEDQFSWICKYAAFTNYSGVVAVIPAIRVSNQELKCDVPALPMSQRGALLNRTISLYLGAKESTMYLTEVTQLPAVHLVPQLQIERTDRRIYFTGRRKMASTVVSPDLYIRVFGQSYFMGEFLRSRLKKCRLSWVRPGLPEISLNLIPSSSSEVICVLPQWRVWNNHEARLSLTMNGKDFSNSLALYFVDQVANMVVVPHVVPPLTKITFNFTAKSDSDLHFEALQNASDLMCDFGPVVPEMPATFVWPSPVYEDHMFLETPGTPSPHVVKGMRWPGIVTWICHSPEEGLPPGVDLEVALVTKSGDKLLPSLNEQLLQVKVQPSMDAARIIPSTVIEGSNAIAEIDFVGAADGLLPVCRFEDCPFVDTDAANSHSSEALLMPGGRVTCQLPMVRQLRVGLSGSSQCNVRVSLNGGRHWSSPAMPVTVIAKPTLFDAHPHHVMADVYCFRCIVVNLIGSHMVHSIDGKGATYPRCMMGDWKGQVVTVQSNVTTCNFHTDSGAGNGKPDSRYTKLVPWSPSQGFVRMSLMEALSSPPTFGSIPEPVYGGIVEVEIADAPSIVSIWPGFVYHVQEQLLRVYGTALPQDPRITCILTNPSRYRFLSNGTAVNSSLVVCTLPQSLPPDTYSVSVRFENLGVFARPATNDPTLQVLHVPKVTRFEPLVASALRSVPVILEGLEVEDTAKTASWKSSHIMCKWNVYARQLGTDVSERRLIFITVPHEAHVYDCTRLSADSEASQFCRISRYFVACNTPTISRSELNIASVEHTAELHLSTCKGKQFFVMYWPVVELYEDAMVLQLSTGRFGKKVFPGRWVEVQTLYVKGANARCQYRAYGKNSRLADDAAMVATRCTPEEAAMSMDVFIQLSNITNGTSQNVQLNVSDFMSHVGTPEYWNVSDLTVHSTPCARKYNQHFSRRERPLLVQAEDSGRPFGLNLVNTSIVRCRVPEDLSQGTWQVGIVNYDSLFATPASFLSLHVLPRSHVHRASPAATSLGSQTPITLYGNELGKLLFQVEKADCVFTMEPGKATRNSSVWILSDSKVACFPPPMDVEHTEGEVVHVTLRVQQTLLTSQASFLLFPQRRMYATPVSDAVYNTPQDLQFQFRLAGANEIRLAGANETQVASPIRLAAQNTWYRSLAAHKQWLTPSAFTLLPGNVTRFNISLDQLERVLSAPVVDYAASYPPGIVLNPYFVDPLDSAAHNAGLSIIATPLLEVSPVVLVKVPKVVEVNPIVIPLPDRSDYASAKTEHPVIGVKGIGFMNTNRLKCRMLDAKNISTILPEVRFISTNEVFCALPVLELPNSVEVLIQITNDGSRWSSEKFFVYLVGALDLRRVDLFPAFGVENGTNAITVTTATRLPAINTLGCLYGLGREARAEAVFLAGSKILCLEDQPAQSLGLRKAGKPKQAAVAGTAVGFRLTLQPPNGSNADSRLITSDETGFTYVRTPVCQRLDPPFGVVGQSVLITGQDFPYGVAQSHHVLCYWALSRVVTNGSLISATQFSCNAPATLPRRSLATEIGYKDSVFQVSFDNGANFIYVASRGLPFVILHNGKGPLVVRMIPTVAREGRGEYIKLIGKDFAPFKELAPVFGVCSFAWNVTLPSGLTNDTGIRESPATFVTGSQVTCKVPLDLPPAQHVVRLHFKYGSSIDAHYSPSDHILTIVPSYALYRAVPQWAPTAGRSQIGIEGARFLPVRNQGSYWCVFGRAPPVPAMRVSLSRLACRPVMHKAEEDITFQIILESPGGVTVRRTDSVLFSYLLVPVVRRLYPAVVLAHRHAQRLQIFGENFVSFFSDCSIASRKFSGLPDHQRFFVGLSLWSIAQCSIYSSNVALRHRRRCRMRSCAWRAVQGSTIFGCRWKI